MKLGLRLTGRTNIIGVAVKGLGRGDTALRYFSEVDIGPDSEGAPPTMTHAA